MATNVKFYDCEFDTNQPYVDRKWTKLAEP